MIAIARAITMSVALVAACICVLYQHPYWAAFFAVFSVLSVGG